MNKLVFDMYMDLHNHTVWSDGEDKPEKIIVNAINHQVEVVGITDHFCNDDKYALGFEELKVYLNEIDGLRKKYCSIIKVCIGVEIAYSYLLKNFRILPYDVLNKLDFILLEDLDYIPAITDLEDVTVLLNGFECSKGLAHTDLIKLAEKYENQGSLDYILDFMQQNDIFWEINTSSAHDAFYNILQPGRYDDRTSSLIDGITKRKIHVTVGSDTHSLMQYDFGRLKAANRVKNLLFMGG